MSRRTDIVVTTIFEPGWLEGYLGNLRAHGHESDTTLRIICDRKTPATVYAAAAAAARSGFRVDCPTLDEQGAYLRRIGLPDDFIPWDSDNRRNIGFLRAWEGGTDVLISIDDDNYCRPESDFVGEHAVVGTAPAGVREAVGAPWFNICSLLDMDVPSAVYPRGYPYAARRQRGAVLREAPSAAAPVAVNAGLWLDDPDVDAMTRLTLAPRALRARPGAVVLAPETWSPINTQNTSLIRDAIPAYYYVRMGFPLQGLRIDRFGDILSGYFVQKCAKHLGHTLRLGSPVADHRRTPHNLFKDQYQELAGVVLIEDLMPWLQSVSIEGHDYPSAYAALADALEAHAADCAGFIWDQGGREYLRETARAMRLWINTIMRLA